MVGLFSADPLFKQVALFTHDPTAKGDTSKEARHSNYARIDYDPQDWVTSSMRNGEFALMNRRPLTFGFKEKCGPVLTETVRYVGFLDAQERLMFYLPLAKPVRMKGDELCRFDTFELEVVTKVTTFQAFSQLRAALSELWEALWSRS